MLPLWWGGWEHSGHTPRELKHPLKATSWQWLSDSATLTTLGHPRLPSPLSFTCVQVLAGGKAAGHISAHSGCFSAAESWRLLPPGREGRAEPRSDTGPFPFLLYLLFLWTSGPSQIFGNYSKLSSYGGKCGVSPYVWEEFPKSPPQWSGPECSATTFPGS